MTSSDWNPYRRSRPRRLAFGSSRNQALLIPYQRAGSKALVWLPRVVRRECRHPVSVVPQALHVDKDRKGCHCLTPPVAARRRARAALLRAGRAGLLDHCLPAHDFRLDIALELVGRRGRYGNMAALVDLASDGGIGDD